MNIDIGIDIDIEEIKSIFVDFYGIFTGLTYSFLKQILFNCLCAFAKNLNICLKFYNFLDLGENIMKK